MKGPWKRRMCQNYDIAADRSPRRGGGDVDEINDFKWCDNWMDSQTLFPTILR